MSDYIEGKRSIIEAFRAGVPVERLYVGDYLSRDSLLDDILRKAAKNNTPVQRIQKKELDKYSKRGAHQGVLAKLEPFAYTPFGNLIAKAACDAEDNLGAALVLVLDHITDAGNFGSIIRSAEVVGASGIVIANKRSVRVEADTYKTSAGAVCAMPIAQVANIASSLRRLQDEGFWVLAATEHAKDCVWNTNLVGKIALVLGNEQEGISSLVLKNSDMAARLPVRGSVESLNVAQAACALAYEWLRQNSAGIVDARIR